ncbi:neural cell adhesion molecule 1-like [Condylostylus longicornis]|uniref:neural cell adhesion molecule 1-like n=1 Tax=Condylostylus longicornis TaxID=2530218 RepID=UPI00244E4C79|nr:neural cell adhesion molecule 1-like [Condylostylus longicornis]
MSRSINCSGLKNFEAVMVLVNANQIERISITPADEEVIKFVNDSIFVLCNIPGEKTVNWRSPKGENVKNARGRVHIESKPPAQLALVFEHISLSDKGNWTCAVEDGVGTAGFNLVVNQRITFLDTNTLQTVREGNEVNLRCEVKGDPEPTVTWSFNGKNIDLTNDAPHRKYRKLGDGLLIKKVTQNDTGEYTCRAYQISDTISDTQDHTILLKIEHKPMWLSHKDINDIRYAYITGEVNLTCEATAEPPANFTWYRQGKKVDKKLHKIFNEPHRSVLNIAVKDSSHLGEYKCIAKNPLGEIERVVKLHEGTKPNPPSTFQLRGLNSNTFDVDVGSVRTSKVRHLMDVSGYRIEYITEYDFKLNGANWSYAKRRDFPFEDENLYDGNEVECINGTSTYRQRFDENGVTFLINNLEPNTTYLMRAAAKNLAGLSSWTKVEKFTTQSNEPPTNSALKRIPLNLNSLIKTILIISIIAVIFSQFNSINFLRSNNLIRFIQLNKNNKIPIVISIDSDAVHLNDEFYTTNDNDIDYNDIDNNDIDSNRNDNIKYLENHFNIIKYMENLFKATVTSILCFVKSSKLSKSSLNLLSKSNSSLSPLQSLSKSTVLEKNQKEILTSISSSPSSSTSSSSSLTLKSFQITSELSSSIISTSMVLPLLSIIPNLEKTSNKIQNTLQFNSASTEFALGIEEKYKAFKIESLNTL